MLICEVRALADEVHSTTVRSQVPIAIFVWGVLVVLVLPDTHHDILALNVLLVCFIFRGTRRETDRETRRETRCVEPETSFWRSRFSGRSGPWRHCVMSFWLFLQHTGLRCG